jgi:hypothetical protein
MSRKMLVPLRLLALDSDPEYGQEGEVYINTVTKNLRVHNGSIWIELTPPSTDPTPFYMHTHTFDGDVHTIDVQHKVDFKNLNSSGPALELPQIIGYDAGSPFDNVVNPTWKDQTLFDPGLYNGLSADSEDTILGGGGSEDFDAPSLDGGNS